MRLYEEIPLPNGLTLEIWDDSREIAAGTTKVELVAQIEVVFAASYFSSQEHFQKLVKTIGPKDLYEYRKVRTFVNSTRKETVFEEMLTAFKKDSLSYLSRDDFPRRFAGSKFREIEKNWYQYMTSDEER